MRDVFFNELSIEQSENITTARQLMNDLIEVYKNLTEKNFKNLRVYKDIYKESLAPDYNISHWLSDPSINRDTRIFFKTKVLNSPFIEDYINLKAENEQKEYEFSYKAKNSLGLGCAFLYDSIAISFNNNEEWDKTEILIDAKYLSEDSKLIEEQKEIKHCSKTIHIQQLQNWIDNIKKTSINNGKELWLKRSENFPNLIFCHSVEKQIEYLNNSHPQFRQICNHLFDFQSYASTWVVGDFDYTKIGRKITPESDTRENSSSLYILCPDGEKRLFSLHSRYTPGAGRIHIYPDTQNRKIYIGYIEHKL